MKETTDSRKAAITGMLAEILAGGVFQVIDTSNFSEEDLAFLKEKHSILIGGERRSAHVWGIMELDYHEPEIECGDYIYEKPGHQPATKRQAMPRNTYKPPLRATMRSVNRNR